jgi:hypothetical protein
MTAAQDRDDSSESTEKADPAENSDANDPTEPTDSTEPTEPMDSTEPRDPIDRNESCDHTDHRDGAGLPPSLMTLIVHRPRPLTGPHGPARDGASGPSPRLRTRSPVSPLTAQGPKIAVSP